MGDEQMWQAGCVAITAAWAAFATTITYELEAWQMALVALGAAALTAVSIWQLLRKGDPG